MLAVQYQIEENTSMSIQEAAAVMAVANQTGSLDGCYKSRLVMMPWTIMHTYRTLGPAALLALTGREGLSS